MGKNNSGGGNSGGGSRSGAGTSGAGSRSGSRSGGGTGARSGAGVGAAIQSGNYGSTINYKEAAKIANQTGTNVDRVFGKATQLGVITSVGSAAAKAGYTPNPQFNTLIKNGYIQNLPAQQQPQANQQTDQPFAFPEFDWEAWNAEMMARQQAVWESMDAMNSEFVRQQQDWYQNASSRIPGAQQQRSGLVGVAGSADLAQVKVKRRTTRTSTNTGPAQQKSTAQASGLNIGGANVAGGSTNGLGIGKMGKD